MRETMTWQTDPPDCSLHVGFLREAFYWARWNGHPRIVEVYAVGDTTISYAVRWDHIHFSPHPEDYEAWWPEPLTPPSD